MGLRSIRGKGVVYIDRTEKMFMSVVIDMAYTAIVVVVVLGLID